ncbi:MAG: response regulator, partial [Lachnospiraceae bacterium]|nr:response regulator [Lachnospiraceae bacterium]
MDTVLVVEDEKMIRQGIATMIKRCGIEVGEVLECPDGPKALETLKNRRVDLMFTDIRMTKLNGIQL